MSLAVDLYWSFRSPYSYFITGRMARLATRGRIRLLKSIEASLASAAAPAASRHSGSPGVGILGRDRE